MTLIVGPGDPAFRFLQTVPERLEVRNGIILVAWARLSGVGLLNAALGETLQNVDVIVGMANRGTSAEALGHLIRMSRRVFVYHKHHLQTFHPKVYLFDDGNGPPHRAALLVGSSNLTGGGLFQNIEANFTLDLKPSEREEDRTTYESAVQGVTGVRDSPFCEELAGDEAIRILLNDRYISNEATLARKRRRDNREVGRLGEERQRPEAPPPPLPVVDIPPLDVNFNDMQVEDYADELPVDGVVQYEAAEQFYVRTLTQNDVNKLRGITPGTAEWDIGETARNERPGFWGWPDQYLPVAHRDVPRREWTVAGSLQSSLTGDAGRDVEIVMWFRQARPDATPPHAAEHRLQIRPRPTLVGAVPENFDTTSLVVLERLPVGRNHTFLVRLLTNEDPGYDDFRGYLTRNRPRHRYGYGP